MTKMHDKEAFKEWFNNTFLFNRSPASLLIQNNSASNLRFARIQEVAEMIIDNPNNPKLRQEVALKFFVSMRIALDYINYAKIVLEKWGKMNHVKL